MKILQLQGPFDPKKPVMWKESSPIGEVTVYNYRKAYGFNGDKQYFWWWDQLDAAWRNADPNLLAMYKEVEELAKEHDVLCHMVGDMFHPEFMRRLSKRNGGPIKTIYFVDGEPDASPALSHPVVKAYDFALTCSTYYDPSRTCVEMLKECRALGADWVAVGTKYPKEHKAWKAPINDDRDIDLVFLGGTVIGYPIDMAYPRNKLVPIFYMKAIAPDLKIEYAPWGDIDKAAELYARSKMGVVFHGPSQYGIGSSQRIWDLAVNGVMVISDGIEFDVGRIFDVGKEIDAFSYQDITKNISFLVDKVRYWKKHEKERLAMARRARARTYKEYRNDEDDNYMLRGIKKAFNYWESINL